jgi:hypothetical protein
VGLDQQVQQAELVEQPARPTVTGDLPGQGPKQTGHARCLAIHHPGGDRVERRVPGPLQTREAAADLVVQPAIQLVQRTGDPRDPRGGSFRRTFRIGQFAGRPRRRLGPSGSLLAASEPFGRIRRRLARGQRAAARQQHQGQRVLARELPARAGARVRRGVVQHHRREVGRRPAALATTPDHRVPLAGLRPAVRARQRDGGTPGAGIGGQSEHLPALPDRHGVSVV